MLNVPRTADYNFKIKTYSLKKFLLIKYSQNMTAKIFKQLELTDDFYPYKVFIEKFKKNLALIRRT